MTTPPRPILRRRRFTPATSCCRPRKRRKPRSSASRGGEDFAKVATELSKDPAGDGGDLGWFTKDRMVPEFADAAFKLQPGQISDPVKSQFGWHIIKVEERRMRTFPPFEELKEQAARFVAQKAQSDLIASLHGTAKIERADESGNLVPDPAPTPSTTPARRRPATTPSPRRPEAITILPAPRLTRGGTPARTPRGLPSTRISRAWPPPPRSRRSRRRPSPPCRRSTACVSPPAPPACAIRGEPTSCWRCSTDRRRSPASSPVRSALRRRSTGAAPA